MGQQFELGLDTFGDITPDGEGRPLPAAQVIRNVVDQAVLAEDPVRAGDHFGRAEAIVAPFVGRISVGVGVELAVR